VTRYVDGGFRTKTMSEDDLMELGPEYDDGEYTWVGDRRGVRGAIRDVQYNAEGYYGNEASTTTFYASAALVITVPPADERKTPPPPLTADRVHVAKVPSKPKPTPAWAKAKAKPTPKAKRPASGATPGRPAATTKRQRRATVDKAKSYAEPEVVDDSEDDSEAEDGTKIKPKLSQCPHAAAAEDSEDEDFDAGAPAAADSDSDDFEMGATVPAPRAAPRAAPARVFARAAADVTGPRTIHVRGIRGNTRAPADGNSDITLREGQGITELKKMIRQIAGKYAHHTMGSLKIGGPGGRNAKKNDLVDGATVHCTYTYTAGNPGFGGFRGRGRSSNHLLFAMMFGGGGGGGMSDY